MSCRRMALSSAAACCAAAGASILLGTAETLALCFPHAHLRDAASRGLSKRFLDCCAFAVLLGLFEVCSNAYNRTLMSQKNRLLSE